MLGDLEAKDLAGKMAIQYIGIAIEELREGSLMFESASGERLDPGSVAKIIENLETFQRMLQITIREHAETVDARRENGAPS